MAQQENSKSGITLWQLVRWTFLGIAILVIILMLKKPAPPSLETSTRQELVKAATSFDTKIADLEQAHARGEAGITVRMTEDELNGFVKRSVGELPPLQEGAKETQASGTPAMGTSGNVPSNDEAGKVPIKSSQIVIVGDEITCQFSAEPYGKEIFVTLSAKLGSENGYAKIHPTGFKVGNLSVPISLVDDIVQKTLNKPENAEKLKLPDFVKDVRVENGQLVIEER